VGAGDAQHAQGFDGSVLAFWDAGASAVQCGAGCIDRVEIVVLAFAAAVRPVRTVDLKDRDAGFGEVSGGGVYGDFRIVHTGSVGLRDPGLGLVPVFVAAEAAAAFPDHIRLRNRTPAMLDTRTPENTGAQVRRAGRSRHLGRCRRDASLQGL
jgi:hypothetical protein